MTQRIFQAAIALAVIWTISMVVWRNAAGEKEEQLIDEIALSHSRALFSLLVDMRTWASEHGGVYVPVTEKTQPNPYLNHPQRDLQTTQGLLLTLVNPAYMTRQVAEIGNVRRSVKVHLTGEDPIRPGNAPQQWEKKALESFRAGAAEYHDLVSERPVGHTFRYMAPLVVEESCRMCHASSKVVGENMGGISITFPVDDLVESRNHLLGLRRIAFASVWLAGLLAIAGVLLLLERLASGRGGQRP